MKTKIKPLEKTKTIDYSSEEIKNLWLQIKEPTPTTLSSQNKKSIISLLKKANNTIICIQTEKLEDSDIIDEIYKASKRENRIYITVNEKSEAWKELAGFALIRYGIRNIGSFVLINPQSKNAEGLAYSSPFTDTGLVDPENILIELSPDTTKTLYRFFSYNFWNHTEWEILQDFNNPGKVKDLPIDIYPNKGDLCDADFVRNKIADIKKGLFIVPGITHEDFVSYENLEDSFILTGLTVNDPDLLVSLGEKETIIIYANKHVLPFRLYEISNKETWAIIPKALINPDDLIYAIPVKREEIKFDAEFEFKSALPREMLKNKKFRLLDNPEEEIKIQGYEEINLNEIKLQELPPQEEFEKKEPQQFPDTGTILKCKYLWKVVPFYTPSNAKKHKLYDSWEKLQKQYEEFLDKINSRLQESNNTPITDKLKRWFLGKRQTLKQYEEKIQELRKEKLAFLPLEKRRRIVKELNEIVAKINKNIESIERKKKEAALQGEIDNLKTTIAEKEKELEKFIQEEESKIKKQEDEKEKKLKEFLEKNNIKQDEIKSFRSKLEQKAGKKNRKKNPEEAKKAKETLNELNEILGFNFRKQLEDEKNKKEKEIKRLKQELERKEKEIAKLKPEEEETSLLTLIEGNEKESQENTEPHSLIENVIDDLPEASSVSSSKEGFNLPDNLLPLPKIGELWQAGNQKFLQIEFWEEYDEALKEAERFKAKLSVKPN